jgi:hypothetical protein
MRGRIAAAALLLAAVIVGAGCSRVSRDSQIATKLKARMSADAVLRGSALYVAVKNGVATLSGAVPSVAARYEAFKMASETPGIKKVNDDMTIEAPIARTASLNSAAPAPETKPKHPIIRHRAIRHARSPAERTSASQVTAETPSPETESEAASAASVPAPAVTPRLVQQTAGPPPERITIPQGTRVSVVMIDSVNSALNQVGDILHASLAKPIKVGKNLVATAGSDVYLRLVQVNSAGHFGGRSELRLELYRIVIQGTSYPLISNDYVDKGVSRTKRALMTILGSGAVGAAIGAIAGGGKGAAIGAAAGGAAGSVYQGATRGKPVIIASETRLKFKLEQPATVTLNPSATPPIPAP